MTERETYTLPDLLAPHEPDEPLYLVWEPAEEFMSAVEADEPESDEDGEDGEGDEDHEWKMVGDDDDEAKDGDEEQDDEEE